MDDPKQELVRGWLIKSQHDLATARKAAADPDPYLDTAIYHCQQAAEKAVKAFLVFRDQRFEKIHDVRLLIETAGKLEPKLSAWLDTGERLTPYAIAFRYPGETLEPDREEFEQAFQDAEGLCNFVLSLLPSEVHPGSSAEDKTAPSE